MYKTITNRRKEDYSTMNNYNTMSNYSTNEEEINQDATEIKLTDVMRNSGSISVNKDLIRFMNEGSNTGLIRATVLTEIISKYEMWKDKGDLQKDGSFFYTADEIENDTGISSYTQRTSVFPYLESLGLLKRESRRHPDNPMKKVRFIKLDVKACIKLFEEVIPKFKEKAEKARHDAMVENQPSEQLKINHPNGRKSTSSNTVLNNTELNNTIYNPPTPQKEQKQKKDSFQENKNLGEREQVLYFIKNNFSKEQQGMLLSVYSNMQNPKEMDVKFLKAYKNAYPKVKASERDILQIKNRLTELIQDLQNGTEIKSTLTGFMIYRLNHGKPNKQMEKQSDQSNEVIPDWFRKQQEEKRKQQELQQKESSYESDYSKYNFNKRGNDDWIKDIEI